MNRDGKHDDAQSYSVPSALPVSWHDGERSAAPGAVSESPVVTGALAEEMAHVLSTGQTCGECRYFSLAQGQALMAGQRFLERLVREDSWQIKHLASPVNQLGVCGAHTSGNKGEHEMLTGKLHKACDQFRPGGAKVISLSRKTTDKR